jgi:hypothetical protein
VQNFQVCRLPVSLSPGAILLSPEELNHIAISTHNYCLAVFALMASTKGKGMYEPLKGQSHDLTCVSEVSEIAEMSHNLGQQSAEHLTPASAYLSIGGSGASKEPAGSRRPSIGSKNPSDGPKRIFSKILGQPENKPTTSSEGSPIIQEPNPPSSAAMQTHGNKPTPKTVTGGDGGMKPEIKFHVFGEVGLPSDDCCVDVVAIYVDGGSDVEAQTSIFTYKESKGYSGPMTTSKQAPSRGGKDALLDAKLQDTATSARKVLVKEQPPIPGNVDRRKVLKYRRR